MLLADLIMLPLALWSAYSLRLSEFYPERYLEPALLLFILMPIIGLISFVKLGLYRAVTRYLTFKAVVVVIKGSILTSLSLYLMAWLLSIDPFPRSVPIIFFLIAVAYVGGSRMFVRSYYHWLLGRYVRRKPLAIYGAGAIGAQLAQSLSVSGEYVPVVFFDDDSNLVGSMVSGLKVESPINLSHFVEALNLEAVLIALPSISDQRKSEILSFVSQYPLQVKIAPTVSDILAGVEVSEIRSIELEDLLGREVVPPQQELLNKNILNKVVLVTGAGGSIGSEICRVVAGLGPKVLLLLDSSEFALYSIERKLEAIKDDVSIVPILGSVCDVELVRRLMSRFGVQTVYHAAAYKHVPLVEQNILQGLNNNVLGTQVIAEASIKNGVERFVMVSTDKAVRPTNVMGATKRFAELVIQSLARESSQTIFSMVRFGNVLGSSGSVIPLFREQIASGGPVTVTHPEITRYFMMIPEAASLVVQAGAMAKGGEVFVLEMGSPVKIYDLARSLIGLSGKTPYIAGESKGDVEIKFTGLRPGEKLFEELLIGGDVTKTEHPMIMSAKEERLEKAILNELLAAAREAVAKGDSLAGKTVLSKAVSGYEPSQQLVDWSALGSDVFSKEGGSNV
jgi:FlaA1/EpsC-like NDP-sugar epimerase